ncbi:MAG: septal ring lytic transglycosylase RlpA family protein [Burkholderiaceae bacterium]|nr:septal ring lytic transglycosylase RlpA family protein [Burkholderiaceae bacterium]
MRWFALAAAAALAGCASAPPPKASPVGSVPGVVARSGPAPASERDGPEANPPADLAAIPDAEPRIEPVRAGGPNKPYDALGRNYVPFTDDRPFVERGLASWYGKKFQGRRTSSGELYNMYAMTAAHPTLPIPSYARVRNPANGREVVVRINDRGPFHPGRIVDLSYTAALKLDVLRGVAPVELERITPEDIRSGAWQRGEAVALQVQRGAAASTTPQATPEVKAAAASPPTTGTAPMTTAAAPASAAVTAAGATAAATDAAVDTSATVAAAAVPTALPGAVPTAEPIAAPIAPPSTTPLSPLPPLPVAETKDAAAQTAQSETPAAAPALTAYTPAARGYWVQIGAFRERSGAETFQRRVADELGWLAPLLAIFDDQKLHRLQAGPYPNRGEAGSASQRIGQALQLKPVIVERR